MSITPIIGKLVAVGTPHGTTQPRALVHCTREQIAGVDRLAMFKPVVIIEVAEWERLRTEAAYASFAREKLERLGAGNPLEFI